MFKLRKRFLLVLYYSLYKFRIAPIPNTGKKSWRFTNWYRSPAMRKRERAIYEEHKQYVRKKRAPYNLGDPWDDIPRADFNNRRCWKNRKIRKQWMKNL